MDSDPNSSYDDLGFDPDVVNRNRSSLNVNRATRSATSEEGEGEGEGESVLVEPLVVETDSSNDSDSTRSNGNSNSLDGETSNSNSNSNSPQSELDRLSQSIECMIPLQPFATSHEERFMLPSSSIPLTSSSSSTCTKDKKTPDTLCAHPIHFHSFTRLTNISTLVRSRFSTCIVCNERISIITGYGDIVTCLACGVFAHRKCINGVDTENKIAKCSVNQKLLEERRRYIENMNTNEGGQVATATVSATTTTTTTTTSQSQTNRNEDNGQLLRQDDNNYDDDDDGVPSDENPECGADEDDDDDAVVVEESPASGVGVILDADDNDDAGGGEEESIQLENAASSNLSQAFPPFTPPRSLGGRGRSRRSRRVRGPGLGRGPPGLEYRLSSTGIGTSTSNNSNIDNTDEEEDGFVWSDAGPPTHWASSPGALKGLSTSSGAAASSTCTSKGDDNDKEEEDECVQSEAENENAWKAPFVNLSRALQHNIFATLNNNDIENKNHEEEEEEQCQSHKEETTIIAPSLSSEMNPNYNQQEETTDHQSTIMEQSKVVMHQISQNIQLQQSQESDLSSSSPSKDHTTAENFNDNDNQKTEDISVVLEEAEPAPPTPTKTRQVIQNIQNASQIVKKTTQTRSSMGIASVAGGVAGAAAGLLVGGPAGIYMGSKIGQVVSVAGVLIEGTIGVGVLAAGITGTVFTVKQLKSGENRILTIGGGDDDSDGKNGSNCKVVLVRPNVVVDPIWEKITMDARRSAPTDRRGGGFPFIRQDVGMKERQRRAKDIVNSEEDEINTQEKIFLLVASSLNDKSSLPGYVYRHLIGKVKSRVEERRKLKKDDDGRDTRSDGDMRAIRQDVHGIIKHITATLLEVRPGFGSSSRLTEISATAVETLVFGEMYTYVMNEIKFEIRDKENALRLKLSTLEREAEATGIKVDTHISQDALQSLNAISSHHSVAEKLRCCVELLEHVSTIGSNANMGADCLLKLVCQHLALAKVSNLNAECIFLEEFARDQQLLQGKEGYALVTMQASLGFLNASQNLVTDVFHDE